MFSTFLPTLRTEIVALKGCALNRSRGCRRYYLRLSLGFYAGRTRPRSVAQLTTSLRSATGYGEALLRGRLAVVCADQSLRGEHESVPVEEKALSLARTASII